MPSSDLSHWLLLAQRLFHNLVALLCVPSTRFGHLFPPAGSPAFLWPSYSHLSRVPNLMGRDTTSRLSVPVFGCPYTVPLRPSPATNEFSRVTHNNFPHIPSRRPRRVHR